MTRTMKRISTIFGLLFLLSLLWVSSAMAEETADPGLVDPNGTATQTDAEMERARMELEKARLETERAKAEAERAKAEAEKARIESQATDNTQNNDVEQPLSTETETPEAEKIVEEVPEGYKHKGFFLRMYTGGGYTGYRGSGTVKTPDAGNVSDPEYNAFGWTGGVSIGGMVVENFAIHADFSIIGSPKRNTDPTEHYFGTIMPGMGFTYYFMPVNVYTTASVGYAGTLMYLNEPEEWEDRFHDTYGVYASLMIGKEWWVHREWGLGLAAKGTYAYTENNDLQLHHGSGSLLFTATFN